ncbi:MAG TPA: aminopeptidase P family N-terminal domain-containing protein [Stellaceae bacterium]|nr:aminopeptidase P family N-terminal domain-containing protein [Stellaceae bacterium]
MRRGLIAWSKAELPEAALAARVARAQVVMGQAGLAALLCYSNNTRPAAASYLCGFVPYWSEGVMLLPREGSPYLVVALSKRVATWIEATSRVARVISTGRFGAEAAKAIAAAGGGTVGVADLDNFPAGIASDMRGAGATLADATALFAELRAAADPAELALGARAAAIAHAALARISGAEADTGAAIAAVEDHARVSGAEECYVSAAPDLAHDRRLLRIEGRVALGASYAIRATVAYKGTWVRLARTLVRDPARADLPRKAAERFAAAVASLPDTAGFAGMTSWLIEGCRIAQPLEPLAGARLATPHALEPGRLVTVQATLEIDGVPIVLAAPALIGAAGAPAALLVPPVF